MARNGAGRQWQGSRGSDCGRDERSLSRIGDPLEAGIPFTPGSSARDPAEEHLMRERVEVCLLEGNFGRALREIGTRLARRLFPDTTLHLIGVVRLACGDLDSAEDCLRRALELRSGLRDPERSVSTHGALALLSVRRADFADAWAQLDRALALDPLSLQLLWNRMCLARLEIDRAEVPAAAALERLEAARRTLEGVDPAWRDEGLRGPYLVSLK